jgi:hypothetical protein
MGGRVISLINYRELRFAESARETGEGRSFCRSLKNGSHSRPMKPRQRFVGSHRDSIDSAKPALMFSRTNVSPKWDRGFLLAALFFVGCLAFVAFGL